MFVIPYILGAVVASVIASIFLIVYAPDLVLVQYTMDILAAGAVLMVLIGIIAVWKEKQLVERGKNILMIGFLIATLVPTGYALTAYIHQVNTSWSGGEIHWHADYEVIVQDETGTYEQLDLIDPSRFCEDSGHESSYMCRLNDRVGATEYHEHNDRRIHLEGTFKDREHATLTAFFRTFGGDLTESRLVYPTNEQVYNITEDGERTLKVIMQTGVGGSRDWCAIAPGLDSEDTCVSRDSGEIATTPQEYVISPIQRGPIDIIWIVFDDEPVQSVLEDLRQDGEYKQFGIEKTGEGY